MRSNTDNTGEIQYLAMEMHVSPLHRRKASRGVNGVAAPLNQRRGTPAHWMEAAAAQATVTAGKAVNFLDGQNLSARGPGVVEGSNEVGVFQGAFAATEADAAVMVGKWRSCDRRRREVQGGLHAVAQTREAKVTALYALEAVQILAASSSSRQCRWQQLGAFRFRGGSRSCAYALEALGEAHLMSCARAAHDVILRAQVARGVFSSYGSGRRLDVFWPHVVCACACELAESKCAEPHFRPKRTLPATHISDRS